jgi:hypothetical protein
MQRTYYRIKITNIVRPLTFIYKGNCENATSKLSNYENATSKFEIVKMSLQTLLICKNTTQNN